MPLHQISKYFFLIACLTFLNGCYEISKVDGIEEVAITDQQIIGAFAIKVTNDQQTLLSIDVSSDLSLANLMVKPIESDTWLPIDSIDMPLKNNSVTQFEIMGDIAFSDTTSLDYQLFDFTLANAAGNKKVDPTVLEYSIPAYKVHNLFSQYQVLPVGERTESVDSADINGDGLIDLVVTAGSNVYLYLQSGDGSMEASKVLPLTNSRPESLKIDDINNDGRLDILVACYNAGIDLFIQTEGFEFTQSLLPTDLSLAIDTGDFNGDGLTDIVNIGWGQKEVSIYYQSESGIFNQFLISPVNYSGYNDVVVADMNGDSLDDIVTMNGQTYNVPNFNIIYQTDTGFLEPVYYDLGENDNSNGIGVGDINSDGLMDVVLTHGGNKPLSHVSLFKGTESGTLSEPETVGSYDIPDTTRIADINGDGRMDVILVHDAWAKIGTYIQNADGTLRAEVVYDLPFSYSGRDSLSIADINNDGVLDLINAGNYDNIAIHYGN